MVAPYSGMVLAGYGYTWNHRNELVGIDFLPDGVNSPYDYSAEDVTYTYDPRGQLTGANYTGTSISDESYQYDENGNRELVVNSAGWNDYSTEPGNRLSSNGNFVYYYDNEGNRVQKLNLSSPSLSVAYEWDHRNRLTKVSTLAAGGNAVIHSVEYVYDAFNQLIQRIVDSDGDTGSAPIEQTVFVHENGQIVLQFDKTGSGSVGPSHVSHRYLWGPGVDQLLADEVVNSLTDAGQNETLFPLTDHLGSVRDIVDEDGIVRKHTAFDSFGRITGEAFYDSAGDPVNESHAEAIDQLFGYTGRPLDEATGLQNNLHRWYDASTGRWMSEDPISFAGGDANLYRYVGNMSTMYLDPTGLEASGGMVREQPYLVGPRCTGEWPTGPKTSHSMDWGLAWENAAEFVHDIWGITEVVGGFFVEPFDWFLTGKEVYSDPWDARSYVGWIPGIPAVVGRAAKRADDIGELYDVGRAYDLRATAPPNQTTAVHHVPGRKHGNTTIGDYNDAGRAGNEAGIRLSCEEHDAVSAAQRLMRIPDSARQALADEIRLLRNNTNAPNSALQKVIDLNRRLHPNELEPLHRSRP